MLTAVSTQQASSETAAPFNCSSDDLARHILNEGFVKGLFSDVTIQALRRTYSLHRFLLARSPFIRRLLTHSSRANLVLPTPDDTNVDSSSFEVALRYLYTPAGEVTDHMVNDENVLKLLNVAAWLELEELCRSCLNFVLERLDDRTAPLFVTRIENELAEGSWKNSLRQRCLGFLFRFAGERTSLLARLPIDWFRRIISSDSLVVTNEFERYRVLKAAVEERRQRKMLRKKLFNASSDSAMESAGRKENPSKIPQSTVPSGTNIEYVKRLGRAGSKGARPSPSTPYTKTLQSPSSRRKRNHEDMSDSESSDLIIDLTDGPTELPLTKCSSARPAVINPAPPSAVPALSDTTDPEEEAVFKDIFDNDIIYTHMSFEQLQILSSDGIVDKSILQEAYWRAGQLATLVKDDVIVPSTLSYPFPRFRFGITFTNLRQQFHEWNANLDKPSSTPTVANNAVDGDDDDHEMHLARIFSNPVTCAGVQYRIILTIASGDDITMQDGSNPGDDDSAAASLPDPLTDPTCLKRTTLPSSSGRKRAEDTPIRELETDEDDATMVEQVKREVRENTAGTTDFRTATPRSNGKATPQRRNKYNVLSPRDKLGATTSALSPPPSKRVCSTFSDPEGRPFCVYAQLQRSRTHDCFPVDYVIYAPGREPESDPMIPVTKCTDEETWVERVVINGKDKGTGRSSNSSEDRLDLTVVIKLLG